MELAHHLSCLILLLLDSAHQVCRHQLGTVGTTHQRGMVFGLAKKGDHFVAMFSGTLFSR